MERAIEYEFERQCDLLESGERIVQETRSWDENVGKTFSQRSKEEAADYRYFPDPDLPKLMIQGVPDFERGAIQKEMPELPEARRARYSTLGIKAEDAKTLIENRSLGELFEKTAKDLANKEAVLLAVNYLTSDLLGLVKKSGGDADTARFAFTPGAFASLIRMAWTKKLSSRGTKYILASIFTSGGEPETLAATLGLEQKNDGEELRRVVGDIIASNTKVANDYRNGKPAALQFLVGLGMKATKGAANPEVLRGIFAELLK